MSTSPNNLMIYGSANMPDLDGVTTGGAVSTSKTILFSDLSTVDTVDYVSSSASDTAVILTMSLRDSTGAIQTEGKTLTGTTIVNGNLSGDRLMKCIATGNVAVGVVAALEHTKVITSHTAQSAGNATGVTPPFITLQAGDGGNVSVNQIIRILNNNPAGVQFQLARVIQVIGDVAYVGANWTTVPGSSTTYDVYNGMLFDLAPNQITEVRRPFYGIESAALGGNTTIFYEKVFVVNNNTVTAALNASIIKQVDPNAGTLDIAIATSLNDTGNITNRQTAPATGIGSFTSGVAPQSLSVPGAGNLPPGNAPNAAGAQAVWLRMTLTAAQAPGKTSFQLNVQGGST